jgi:hypothetical protein
MNIDIFGYVKAGGVKCLYCPLGNIGSTLCVSLTRTNNKHCHGWPAQP